MAAAVAMVTGLIVIQSSISSGAPSGPVSFVDYSQCANGAPGSESAADADDCVPQGWINGIMQASNSHFRESEVTPQRAMLDINSNPAGTCDETVQTGCHSITLVYQARKGTTHAYDSLATWNHTVTDANRCQGLTLTATQQTSVKCGANGLPTSNTPDSTLAITEDTTAVYDAPNNATGGVDKHTNVHDLNGQQLEMYGGTLVAMTAPTHDAPDCTNKCSDDYATTTIYYSADVGSTVQLLFGGHLAVSPLNRGGWGPGLGSSNINGGPYHIKWDLADGDSIGQRDNQIMGSAIQPLAEPTISTSSSPQTATPGIAVNLTDTVTLVGATDPTGTAHFNLRLYDTSTTPPTCTTAAFPELTSNTWAKTGGGTGTGTWTTSVTKSAFTFTSPGVYYWVVSVDADSENTAAGPHGCGDSTEIVTVSKLTPGGSTVILLDDSVTITGNGTNVPTGTVTFTLHLNDATCATASKVYDSGAVPVTTSGTSAVASTTANTATVAGTYRWLVTYSGDTIYSASTPSNCTETAVIS